MDPTGNALAEARYGDHRRARLAAGRRPPLRNLGGTRHAAQPGVQGTLEHRLKPAATDMRDALLADDRAPTTRITGWGNAEATPAPVTPNLLDPQSVVIQFRAQWPGVQLQHPPAALVDGKADAPPAPWLAWGDVGNFAETSPFNYLLLDTYRTRLRVTAITLVEDPAHPESWLRDTVLEAWDATAEKWVPVQPLCYRMRPSTHTN